MWKQKQLDWLSKPGIYKRECSDMCGVYSKLPSYTMHTFSHNMLKKLREDAYVDGTKRVAPIIDDEGFDALSLTVWYFDDGSLNRKYGTVTFATNGFAKEDVVRLIRFLSDRFEIIATAEPRRNNTFAIRINPTKTVRFFNVINSRRADFPTSMLYKLPSQ